MKQFLILALLLIYTPAFALKFVEKKILTNCDMSLATCISEGQDLSNVPLGSIHAIWTGAPTGTMIVQVSNDIVADQSLVTNWTTYSGSTIAIVAADSAMINFSNAGYRWIRLSYTKTSGTGSLNATLDTKGDY